MTADTVPADAVVRCVTWPPPGSIWWNPNAMRGDHLKRQLGDLEFPVVEPQWAHITGPGSTTRHPGSKGKGKGSGKAWTDKFNPDETLKSKPLNGLVFISDLKAVAPGYWEGNLYNPRDGRTYRGSLQQQGPDKLELKGCALFGLICQSEFWTRVAP